MSESQNVTDNAPAKKRSSRKVTLRNGKKVAVTNGRVKFDAVAIATAGNGRPGVTLRGILRSNFADIKGDKKLINGKTRANDGNRWGDTISVDTLKKCKLVK